MSSQEELILFPIKTIWKIIFSQSKWFKLQLILESHAFYITFHIHTFKDISRVF